MKFKGKKASVSTAGKVNLPRPNGEDIEFEIEALPLGYDEVLDKMFPPPTPPSEITMTRAGKIVRDENGKPVRDYNYDDPKYRSEVQTQANCRMMYMVEQAIRNQKDWQFETKREDGMSDEKFYLSLFDEIKESGFSPGDLSILVSGILRVSNMSKEALEEARSDF